MRPTPIPPHDAMAERSLLGAMMLSAEALADGVTAVTVGDFYVPGHAAVFAALAAMYARGATVDAVTVADELGRDGQLEQVGGLVGLVELQAECPSTTNARAYAAVLGRHTLARRLIRVAAEIGEAAWDLRSDAYELVDRLQAELVDMGGPAGLPGDAREWDRFWDRPQETHKPWIIPGMIRLGWRIVIVAPEGKGKTFLTRQIALCAGQGIHPFTFVDIEPIRTLYVDLENPEEHLDMTGDLMRPRLRLTAGDTYQADRTWLWHRESGVNLRSRAGRAALEAVIRHVHPQLVVIAPLYKAVRSKPNETYEQAAEEVQDVFDSLRIRYGFALILEHHAPRGATRARDMVPFGSSLWFRWPDMGKALTVTGEHDALTVGIYRPDRMPCRWPDRLDRGQRGDWPWKGYYERGIYEQEEVF